MGSLCKVYKAKCIGTKKLKGNSSMKYRILHGRIVDLHGGSSFRYG